MFIGSFKGTYMKIHLIIYIYIYDDKEDNQYSTLILNT